MNKKRILIVDDDKTILTSFSEILQSKGYSIDTAENGTEALAKTDKAFYNLVLLDIKLPDMEGIDLLNSIKETSPKMMKIVISGYASLENSVAALNRGADAYLIKPVDPEELVRVVGEKLKKQEISGNMSQEKVSEWIESRVRKLAQESEDN
ncbi:MAG: response regulator [Thaumarchaeota archaeon]|nr:response regulator [Nitrososphaerota archaeon]MCL5317457.1 response regulator [Nitrososphaerota archaeon]